MLRVFITVLIVIALSLLYASDPVPVFKNLPPIRALGFNPQGALFATVGNGSVVQIVGAEAHRTLASLGDPRGLAFDAESHIYVADAARKAILRVAPWGAVSVAVDACQGRSLVEPVDVAIAPSGVFFADSGSSLIARLDGTVITDRVTGVAALAASSDGWLVAADKNGGIWRIDTDGSAVRKLASLGQPVSGLALDGKGNIYAAAEKELVVVSLDGRIERQDRFSKPLSDVAFGMRDRHSLFVSDAQGEIHRVQAQARSDWAVWESDAPLRITAPINGDILNRHDGALVEGGLRITVRGEIRGQGPVTVNGITAETRDGAFSAQIVLSERESRILALGEGDLRDEILVLWDRDSYPRYRVSVDDNIQWLEDIAHHDPPYRSIFENPYLGFWRQMHDRYGAKVHFNVYFEMAGFDLTQMPDRYREEWQQNADWLRLTFHARANDPDRPYMHSTAERIRDDYRLVTREIERFAGKELLSDVTTVHWGEANPAAVAALRAEGVRALVGYFQLQNDLPLVSYDVSMRHLLNLSGRDYWKDTRRDILFVRHDMVINNVDLDQVVPSLEKLAADPHQSEVIELMIHEQYWYPGYVRYLPDYGERVERAIQWVTERGYRPVFFADGFLGAKASP